MAATPARQFRVTDALWNAAKDAAARRDTTRTAYLVAKLEELVAADRAERAFVEGLEAAAAPPDACPVCGAADELEHCTTASGRDHAARNRPRRVEAVR